MNVTIDIEGSIDSTRPEREPCPELGLTYVISQSRQPLKQHHIISNTMDPYPIAKSYVLPGILFPDGITAECPKQVGEKNLVCRKRLVNISHS